MTKQKLPKWFKGVLYTKGDNVTNPFSGENIELTATELSIYDAVMGASYIGDTRGWDNSLIDLVQKGIKWFKANNAKAYVVLLD